MQKHFTPQKKTGLGTVKKTILNRFAFQPQAKTLQKILEFASAYRVEKTVDNQYIEWYLN